MKVVDNLVSLPEVLPSISQGLGSGPGTSRYWPSGWQKTMLNEDPQRPYPGLGPDFRLKHPSGEGRKDSWQQQEGTAGVGNEPVNQDARVANNAGTTVPSTAPFLHPDPNYTYKGGDGDDLIGDKTHRTSSSLSSVSSTVILPTERRQSEDTFNRAVNATMIPSSRQISVVSSPHTVDPGAHFSLSRPSPYTAPGPTSHTGFSSPSIHEGDILSRTGETLETASHLYYFVQKNLEARHMRPSLEAFDFILQRVRTATKVLENWRASVLEEELAKQETHQPNGLANGHVINGNGMISHPIQQQPMPPALPQLVPSPHVGMPGQAPGLPGIHGQGVLGGPSLGAPGPGVAIVPIVAGHMTSTAHGSTQPHISSTQFSNIMQFSSPVNLGSGDSRRFSASEPHRRTRKRQREPCEITICRQCGVSQTPEWRRGPSGARTLCNACGLYHAKLVKKKGQTAAAEILRTKREKAKESGGSYVLDNDDSDEKTSAVY